MIDVIVLQLDLFRNTLAKRRHVSQDFTALLHAYIENFELFIDIFGSLFDLSRQLFCVFDLFFEAMVYSLEDARFKYFGIVGDHECDLCDFILIFILIDFDFMQNVGCF